MLCEYDFGGLLTSYYFLFPQKKYKNYLKMSSKFTVVYYYVPEDHDDPSIPNAFG